MFQIFKNIFKSKPSVRLDDYSVIGTDMHSHLIAGIDDGVKVQSEALEILTTLNELGYSKFVTTPHIMSGGYDNTTEIITKGKDSLNAFLKENNSDLEVLCSSEYYLDGHFENLIAQKDLMPFGNNYILFELSFMFKPLNLEHVIFELGLEGYRPILAHPERYNYLADKDLKALKKIKDTGVLFQLNLFSLAGAYGPKAKEVAKKLIEAKMVDFVGTDIHNPLQLKYLEGLLTDEHLYELIQQDKLLNKTLV